MQPLTPAPLLTNKGDLISQKRANRMSSSNTLTPSHQQYNQQQTKVKDMLEQFDLIHQNNDGNGNGDGDDDDEEDPFGSTSMGILPLSKSFNPPPVTQSVATQQKIGGEQQQIKASQMHNAQMGYDTTPLVAQSQPYPPQTQPLKEGFNEQQQANDLANLTENQYGKYLGAATLAQSTAINQGNMDVDLYRLGATAIPTWAQKGGIGGGSGGTTTTPTWKPATPMNGDDLLMTKLNYMINLLEEQKDEKTENMTEEIVLYSFLGVFMIFIVDSFSRVGKYVR